MTDNIIISIALSFVCVYLVGVMTGIVISGTIDRRTKCPTEQKVIRETKFGFIHAWRTRNEGNSEQP